VGPNLTLQADFIRLS